MRYNRKPSFRAMAGKAYKGSSSNMVGSEGFLTLTIKMRVRPEPEWGKSPYLGDL